MPDDAAPKAPRYRWPRTPRRSAGRDEFLAGPIRGELLGNEQLATKARTLAAGQRLRPVTRARREAPLLARVTQTRDILQDIHSRLAAGASRDVEVGPAGDWLLDNFHVVLEHIREVQETLPRGYYRELPVLASGTLAGYPRIYELAITLISHSEARVDVDNLELFVAAFQENATLAIGELWAIPAMLRLALIESVRRMALRTSQRMDDVEQADAWAARIDAAAASDGDGALGATLDRFVDAPPRLSPVFISRFLRQLRQSGDGSSRLAHVEQWITDRALSAEDATARSTQHLALTQVIMAHSITSLRAITHIDWPAFVEGQSAADSALSRDPSGYYGQMTFETRDRYRHVIERIARRTGMAEADVAGVAVDLAVAEAEGPVGATGYRAHVGFWLIDDGLAELEAATGYRSGPVGAMHRWVLRHPDAILGGGIIAATVAALGALLALAGAEARAAWLFVLLVGFLPALDLAIAVVNQLVTVFLPPRRLPALDLRGKRGIPEQFRTAVVVPTLFDSVEAVGGAFDHLEVQFLANRQPHLHFALLSDFTDAAAETCAEDQEILAAAAERVRSLNDKYAVGGQDAFYLLHRPRRWNPSQGVWMGWERKRGKLAEFNQFLRGADGAFMAVVGNVEPLRRVRYVITLDSDTVLPPAAAAQLIGAIAHPLNRAVYDPARGRVVRGYGILQPRVGVSLPSAHASRFAAIHSGHPGVDPYTTAVSDVYQDLYGEGSFTGKGIYDVDAFEEATHGRFPENTLLSHDLIEGSYARAGLATDINVYDDYPSRYLTYTRRKHRWIRGDWQLLEWLTPHVPGPDGTERNRLAALSRWKIVDNLRRSTTEIAQLAFLVAGWIVFPGSPLRWTALGLAAIAGPWIASIALAAVRPPLDKSWRAYYTAVGRDAATSAQQVGLAIAFLPHQAFVSADAIIRTLWRLLVSRRHLLEWQSASHAERVIATATGGAWRNMWSAVAMALIAVAVAAIGVLGGAAVLPLAVAVLPLAGLWAVSPVIGQALGRPARAKGRLMTAEDRNEAIRYARAHWRYFAEMATADTHWLVPDNFQEDPTPVVAMRTSPTNIGLQLLAIASARDLGLIDTQDMTGRLERAFQSLERMRRYRGHFFNWYGLADLEVLEPAYVSTVDSGNLAGHLLALRHALLEGAPTRDLEARLGALADRAGRYVAEMDFRFLFDERRELFSIGFHYGTRTLDSSFYDLLASESRLASFVAIAKGDVPAEHWFRLGRTLTHAAGETALVSWSGSMFEYLMPGLVMRSFPATLLDLTFGGAVRRHIAYGREHGLPWGVSESAYNLRDRHLTYQYRAFGVPDLALKRGLGRDLVIAPYASLLAIAVDPPHAMSNLAALEAKGALGMYGFRDALDYTRPDPGSRYAVVGTYMAHHVGMSLVALTNGLIGNVWQERFHADPLVRGAELLLYERIPRRLVLQEAQETRAGEALPDPEAESPMVREFDRPDTPHPHVALLGRHPYTLMLTHCGSGYSRFEDIAVTRWRDDPTRDATGQYCYLKDVVSGRRWSAAHQPVRAPADWYRALLATDRVTFRRSDDRIETRTEIAVVPEDAAEVRCVTVTNHGAETREIELTSYGEIVLGPADADRAHPAFSSLFVETAWHEWCSAITATRRPRSAGEPALWCVHVVDAGSHRVGPVTCETDRARFIGRGGTTRAPAAMQTDGPLSGTTGAVLDPIFALRTRVRLEPHQSASVSFTTLVAPTRERAFHLADRYHESHAAQRALDLAWTSQQVELRELNLKPAEAGIFQELAGFILDPRAELRSPPAELEDGQGAQDLLWATGISGDWPILLATIESAEGLPTLQRILVAHHYLRRRGLTVDLVVLLTQPSSYLQELRDRITEAMVAANDAETDRPGGVFVRAADQLAPDVRRMLGATARVALHCDGRSLSRILDGAAPRDVAEPTDAAGWTRPPDLERQPAHPWPAARRIHAHPAIGAAPDRPLLPPPAPHASPAFSSGEASHERAPLLFDNGFGGLTPDGDYEIRIRGGSLPPAPWANVVANERGGFLVSERGAGYTWAGSSYFFRLTPWHNDPVSDPVSEVIYIRDAASGALWSPTPAPLGGHVACTVRHGAGFSTFESERHGIASHLTLAMAGDESVKLSVLRLTNRSEQSRRLELTAYVEWTLGVTREQTRHQLRTEYDEALGAILARNAFDADFAGMVAFCAISELPIDHTADRSEFLGRNRSLEDPAALGGGPFRGATGSGFDPCAALRCVLDLAPGESRELVVLLGAVHGRDEAGRTIARLRADGGAGTAAAGSVDRWRERLSVVTVRTPEPAFDAVLNRWTLYQALSCRMWARSALYQSSGAYGFRDQLQDVVAFLHAEPGVAREHILRAAARQFVEGDVQHWWHPQSGRGVRTRFSDDLAWLPWAVDRYVSVTGDDSVLQEYVPFLTMRQLEPDEHEIYDLPQTTDEHGSVYEHCLRALRKACTRGPHGLPLIGSGDWNDGMSRVGIEGRGESVWLAWFLIATLRAFAVRADNMGDQDVAADFRDRADAYTDAVETHGWDGEWYRRAWFDDGTPLGSSESDEARIDSIAQSWSVISGAGRSDRQTRAMRSVEQHLVREADRLIVLLTPPFDETAADPGYIKGYLPGVRENGAQYTHAALWTVLATALRGDGDRAFQLFQMLNPLTHGATPDDVATYRVEPYVVAADVYTAPGLVGRGGWTWYTGSASWMYRVGLETILGFTRRGDTLRIDPRVPAHWPEFSIDYRFGAALYSITVVCPAALHAGGPVVSLDGRILPGATIPLVDDGRGHRVVVSAGPAQ